MERTVQILLMALDASLRGEVEGAVGELPDDMRCAVHTETDRRRGIEHALNRRPDVILLDLGEDVREAQRTALEIQRGADDPLVVVVYRPDALSTDAGSTELIGLMRAGARDFLRRPVSGTELEELLRRGFAGKEHVKHARGRVVSFLGNKGGVGKSTLALSVACGLAREAPGRVLLIDASLQHGAMCDLLGLEPEATLSDAARQVERLDERLLRMFSISHESGLRVLASPSNAIDAAPVDDQTFTRVLAVARNAFDYVVVDTFPLIDSVTVSILDVADLVFVVLDDMVPAVLGTAAMLEVLERLGVSEERLRVVLNHAKGGYRGRPRAVDIAERLGRDLDFVVPFSRRVLASTNSGEPYALRAPRWWGFGKAVRAIEREVLQWSGSDAPRERTEIIEPAELEARPDPEPQRDVPRAGAPGGVTSLEASEPW